MTKIQLTRVLEFILKEVTFFCNIPHDSKIKFKVYFFLMEKITNLSKTNLFYWGNSQWSWWGIDILVSGMIFYVSYGHNIGLQYSAFATVCFPGCYPLYMEREKRTSSRWAFYRSIFASKEHRQTHPEPYWFNAWETS